MAWAWEYHWPLMGYNLFWPTLKEHSSNSERTTYPTTVTHWWFHWHLAHGFAPILTTQNYCACLNCKCNMHGLSWKFFPLSCNCNFMDLTTTKIANKLPTTIYESHKTNTHTAHLLHTPREPNPWQHLWQHPPVYCSVSIKLTEPSNYTPAYSNVDTHLHTSSHTSPMPIAIQ